MAYHIQKKHLFLLAILVLAVFVVVADMLRIDQEVRKEVLAEWQSPEDSGGEKIFRYDENRSSNRLHAPYPSSPSKEQMLSYIKTAGCVADGFLSGYGDEEEIGALLARSECEYAHRAVETWREPPDFEEAVRIMKLVGRPMVYGMFIAEAIDTKDDYTYGTESRDFSFKKMCKAGSENYWGEHTCVPHTSRNEYRRYIDQITKDAMESGVRVFMFGQVFMQDDVNETHMPEIVQSIREYAQFLNVDILVGAQTNDIEDEEYLRLFDFIEGGVGFRADGSIDPGKCSSRWWKNGVGWCWALLAHEHWREKANNVVVHLDWNGNIGDEMNRFASMSREKRAQAMRDLSSYYTSQGISFLFPFLTPLDSANGGCYGEKTRYYSPDNTHECKDENVMNEIMKEAKKNM